jgi:hypothetical protein
MSRESNELNEQEFYQSLLGRGPGDGDFYGYPGEDEATDTE